MVIRHLAILLMLLALTGCLQQEQEVNTPIRETDAASVVTVTPQHTPAVVEKKIPLRLFILRHRLKMWVNRR